MADTKKPSSTIGLKNVVMAEMTSDTEAGAEYGAVEVMVGAVQAVVTPQNADPDVQYADDEEYDVLYPDPELEFSLKLADIPLAQRVKLLGHRLDANGVMLKNASDKPPYFAVGFQSEKADHTFRYVWLYKVRATPITETYATKEGKNSTRQTGEVKFTAIKRNYDGEYQAVADEGLNGFTEEKAASFLATVYQPVAATA